MLFPLLDSVIQAQVSLPVGLPSQLAQKYAVASKHQRRLALRSKGCYVHQLCYVSQQFRSRYTK
jgi:hypothetical protein